MKHIQKLRKLILTFGIFVGMSMTAHADNTETLLTTITPTGKTTYSETTSGVVTVSHDNDSYTTVYGWEWNFKSGTLTVSGCEGYTITKVIFKQSSNVTFTDSSEPFELHFVYEQPSTHCQENYQLSGVKSIEVYGYTNQTTVAVTGVSLNKENSTLSVGDTETLTATVSPDDATDKTITWSSDNTAVATVSDGVVTAVAEGTATITVTATNGTDDTSDDKTATCAVTVASAATPISYITTSADPYNTGAYYATFYDSTKSYTADCEVYYATANADGRLTLQKAEGNVIKAREGVILKATSETVTLKPTTTEASYDSLLTGSDTETTVENALVLSLGKNGVWFYKYSGTLGANKAYLAQ
ncbi:MAG: Ig domain-containing protein [Treponema sp.]|nr:Ig domain-containing protein [Treponema sp.]